MLRLRDSSMDGARTRGAAPAAPDDAGPRARRGRLLAGCLGALGLALWLGLVTWQLAAVPGMSLDEAWTILSARGQWPPENPLSGMTSYAGPFPVLLLEWLGSEHGVWTLRAASVLGNGAALALTGCLLQRVHPGRAVALWGLPLLATCPVLLVVMRTGIEIVMFMPLLAVLGLYLIGQGSRPALFVAGLAWGLLVYNHVIGACFPIAAALAWRVVYRRWPALPLRPLLLGGLLGLAPRLVALALYHRPLHGTAAKYSLLAALGDLRWLPSCLWRTWQGSTVYLRYVGRLAHEPWPYWLLAGVFVWPWRGRFRALPKPASFTLLLACFSAILVTLAAPYMAVRFFLVPILALTASLVSFGAAAIDADRRFRWPVVGSALLLTALNLFYCISNFHVPWRRRELAYTQFFLGDRSKRTGNWAFFPKDELARELLALSPPPEQVLTVPTLERPLRVLLEGEPIRVTLPPEGDRQLRTVFVDYRKPDALGPHCVEVPGRRICFQEPRPIAEHFLLYP